MSVSRFSPVAVSYRVTSDPLSSSAALTTRYDWPPSNHFGACGSLAENSPEKIRAIMSLCCACCGTAADTATLRAMHNRVRNGKRTLTQELIFMMSRSPRRYLTLSNGPGDSGMNPDEDSETARVRGQPRSARIF